MEIDNELVRTLAVHAVEQFINDKTPLDDCIVKSASELELNSEQVKRVIEASNTIAYLKLQKEAQDKTFEFPVASYDTVMQKLCVPDSVDGTIAEDDFKTDMLKAATIEEYNIDPQMAKVLLHKAYQANKQHLEKIAFDKEEILVNIERAVSKTSGDIHALEKLAMVATEDDYKKLSHLFKPKECVDNLIFKEAELDEVKKLYDLYKQAQVILEKEEEFKQFEKKAFLHVLAGGLGKAIGTPIGAAVGAGTSAGSSIAKNFGKQKAISKLDIAAAGLTEPHPARNVWDNLQGTQRRY